MILDDPPSATPVLEGEVLKPEKQYKPWQFKPGDPRINRSGRKPGSKQIIGEAFLKDLVKWHKLHGWKAIEKVGREKPEELLRIMASMIPKHDLLEVAHQGGITVQSIDLQEIERRTHELISRIEMGDREDAGEE